MESQQQQPTRPENPLQLAQSRYDFIPRDVDDGVERGDAAPRLVRDIQRGHVALFEFNAWIKPPGLLDHAWRQIDPTDARAALMQVRRDVAWPAAHVTDRSEVLNARGEVFISHTSLNVG